MGNGALPNGPSYRAHPRLYQSGLRGSAFGGEADVAVTLGQVAFGPKADMLPVLVWAKLPGSRQARFWLGCLFQNEGLTR